MSFTSQVFATETRAARWKRRGTACYTAGSALSSLDAAAFILENLGKDWLDCQQVSVLQQSGCVDLFF